MKILSIDPGYGRAGFAILEKINTETSLITSSCLETDPSKTFPERLTEVIDENGKVY